MKESYLTTTRLAQGESAPAAPLTDFVKDAAGNVSVVTPTGAQPVATTQTVAAAIVAGAAPNWAANTAVEINQLRVATVAVGSIRVGDLIRSNSTRTTGATFDATEAANWTEVSVETVVNNTLTSTSTTEALSAAQGKALQDAKAPLASPAFTGTPTGITKTHVGLGNVDNTSDAGKPVSTAQQTALDAKQATLVSGTTIKTVNGLSVLGAGDIPAVVTVTNTALPSLTAGATITANTVLSDYGGVHYAVDATAGNIAIILPTAVGNSGEFVEFLRIDGSANTVTVFTSMPTQTFSGIQPNAIGIGLKSLGGLTVSSDGANPVVRSWKLPANVSRLWAPTDAAAGSPAIWHDILDAARLTLSGTAITGIGNKGSLGAGYDIVQATGTSQPALVGTSGVVGSYAQFDGGDVLASTAQNYYGSTVFTFAGLYQQPTAANATPFGMDGGGAGSRIQFHAKWSDGVTYFDMGTTATSRMSGNLGTVPAGSAVNHTVAAVRNGASQQAYFDGNPTASLTKTDSSGSPSGTTPFRWSGDAGGNQMPANSRLYETVCYAVALSTADMDRLAGYLAWRHGSQSIINAGNAYRNAPPVIALATY